MTLSPSAGDEVAIKDYAGTFKYKRNVTIACNSSNIQPRLTHY